ncbi:MAG: VOC family protein [Lachnospiraceae bacterium]
MNLIQTEIMLYVKDVEGSKRFWTEKIGFQVQEERKGPENSASYALAGADSDTVLVLLNKALVERFSPEVFLGIPSLMFRVSDLEQTREDMLSHDVSVSEIQELAGQMTFHFCDDEGNYFAVGEKRN